MLKLYYAPGACSMASHIALEETGAPYERQIVNLPKGEQRTPAYLAVNARGKVPALQIDDAVLTENTAIITYLARRFPEAKLLPADLLGEAKAISAMAWLSNSVHIHFTRVARTERFAGPEAQQSVKEVARATFWDALKETDDLLAATGWMVGPSFSGADAYALVFYGWGKRIDLPVAELAHYTALKDRLLERPAVRRVLESEQSILLPRAAAA